MVKMMCANQTDKYNCPNKAQEGSRFCDSTCEHAFKQIQYHKWNEATTK